MRSGRIRRLVPQVVRHWRAEHGYAPVFVDGTGIHMSGKRFEGALELADDEWVELDEDGEEQATTEVYVVIRWDRAGDQRRLVPDWTVILVSRDDLPLPELVLGYRGKQGQENVD